MLERLQIVKSGERVTVKAEERRFPRLFLSTEWAGIILNP